MLLGWLQRRRFEREAMAKGASLDDVPGMLDTALRLAAATAVAIAVGLGVPGFAPTAAAGRVPCREFYAGHGAVRGRAWTYVALASVLGVTELSELEGLVLRELKSRFKGAQQQ